MTECLQIHFPPQKACGPFLHCPESFHQEVKNSDLIMGNAGRNITKYLDIKVSRANITQESALLLKRLRKQHFT